MFKIGIVQFSPLFGQPEKNLQKVLSLIQNTTADLIVLPELAFTGYYFKDRAEVELLAEEVTKSVVLDEVNKFCNEKGCYVVAGFAEKAGDKYFNSAILTGPEGVEYIYRKIHLFNDEKYWFDPGEQAPEIPTFKGVKIGIMICWDWVFPEMARILSIQGAEIICHPANLVLDLCQRTMVGRSIENGVFTVTANRYGEDKRPHGILNFTGRSQIVNPFGEILYRAKATGDSYFELIIDPEQARNKFRTSRNHLFDDRRPELYTLLTGK